MANGGSFSLTSGGYEYLVEWKQTQSIENNTSTITCTHKLICGAGYDLYIGTRSNTITVDGVTTTWTSPKISTGGNTTLTLGTTTHTVAHDSQGAKTVSMTAVFNVQATINGSYRAKWETSTTVALDTIPRKSTISASSGTLGTAQTLTVSRKYSGFTHTVTYKCGSASGTICEKSSSTSLTWTPPLDLARQNTTGASVSIVLTITTYNGSTSIGSNTTTFTCAIPASVEPSLSVSVTDVSGCFDKYGKYVQGKSSLRVVLSAAGELGSTIKSYTTHVDGSTYTAAEFTTAALKAVVGSVSVNASVTDSRGRVAVVNQDLTVLRYSTPMITALAVHRCDADGTENGQGEYVEVTFSGSVTPLDDKNSAAYTLRYKKTTATEWTETPLGDYAGQYTVARASVIFLADTGSSYDVAVVAADDLGASTLATVVSTGFTLMHWGADGTSMGFGKVAEIPNLLDFGLPTRFRSGVTFDDPPVADKTTLWYAARHAAPNDLLNVMLNGDYSADNMQSGYIATEDASTLVNSPITSGAFYAFRTVDAYPVGHVCVRLREMYPCNGRVWSNMYDKNVQNWYGWDANFGGTISDYATVNSDDELKTWLDQLLAKMVDNSAKQVRFMHGGSQVVNGVHGMGGQGMMFGTLYKHTASYAILRVSSYTGANFQLVKLSTWGEVEWENPRCGAGVEYRTTERFNGSPVYTKLFDCGTVVNRTTITTDITNVIRYSGRYGSLPIPMVTVDGGYSASVEVNNGYAVFILTGFTGNKGYLQLWYVK